MPATQINLILEYWSSTELKQQPLFITVPTQVSPRPKMQMQQCHPIPRRFSKKTTVGGTNLTPVSPRPKTQQKITPAKASCPH